MLRALLLPRRSRWTSLPLLLQSLPRSLCPTLPPAMRAPINVVAAVLRLLMPSVHATSTAGLETGRWLISTFRRRRTKMNRHKLKKRRKLLRLNTKISRS